MKNRMTVKKFFGAGVKVLLAIIVIAFLGLKSLDFFNFTTPADQWYYAYLGFGLTGGGVIGYLIVFMFDADTEMKKTISIIMLGVCILGELVTAGFGLQVNAWQQAGFTMQESDFKAMVLAVQLLGFAHAMALVAYIAGDKIMEAFGDHDGDGTPNFADKDYQALVAQQNEIIKNLRRELAKPAQQPARPAFASDIDQIGDITPNPRGREDSPQK